jgi:hypothetical protein
VVGATRAPPRRGVRRGAPTLESSRRNALRGLIAATRTSEPLIDAAPSAAACRATPAWSTRPAAQRRAGRATTRASPTSRPRALADANASRLAATVAQVERWIDDGLARRARRHVVTEGTLR